VRRVADAACLACTPDYELLRPVLLELKRRYFNGKRTVLQWEGVFREGLPDEL